MVNLVAKIPKNISEQSEFWYCRNRRQHKEKEFGKLSEDLKAGNTSGVGLREPIFDSRLPLPSTGKIEMGAWVFTIAR
jgi:hypothetical protein